MSKRSFWKSGLAAAVTAFALSASVGSADVGDAAEILYVTTAESMRYDEAANTITLREVAPQVIWFTDRPYRKAGHTPLAAFLDGWSEGDDSFAADPPNAVVTYDDLVGEPAIVEIMNPSVDGDSVTYEIVLLQGDLPATGDNVTVVVDGCRVLEFFSGICPFN